MRLVYGLQGYVNGAVEAKPPMAEQTSLSFLARFLPSRGINLKASQGSPATDLVRTISQRSIGATKDQVLIGDW
jgi:hypothetical protein